MAAATTITVEVSLTELEETRALAYAAAVLLSTLGERGELRSYDREPARLAQCIDVLAATLEAKKLPPLLPQR
jgi:hypothetical protein